MRVFHDVNSFKPSRGNEMADVVHLLVELLLFSDLGAQDWVIPG
jgi:hypothetical protein